MHGTITLPLIGSYKHPYLLETDYYRICLPLQDTYTVVKWAEEHFSETKLVLWGHSLGTGVSVEFLATYPNTSVIGECPFLPNYGLNNSFFYSKCTLVHLLIFQDTPLCRWSLLLFITIPIAGCVLEAPFLNSTCGAMNHPMVLTLISNDMLKQAVRVTLQDIFPTDELIHQ